MKGAADTFEGGWLAGRALLPTAGGDPWAVHGSITEGKPLSRRLGVVRFGGTVSAPFSALTPAHHGALSHHAPLGKVSLFLSKDDTAGSPALHLSTFPRTADSLLTLEYSEPKEQPPRRCEFGLTWRGHALLRTFGNLAVNCLLEHGQRQTV